MYSECLVYSVELLVTLILLNPVFIVFLKTGDPDQLTSDKAISSGSTLFSTLIENTCFQLECCRLKDTNLGRVTN